MADPEGLGRVRGLGGGGVRGLGGGGVGGYTRSFVRSFVHSFVRSLFNPPGGIFVLLVSLIILTDLPFGGTPPPSLIPGSATGKQINLIYLYINKSNLQLVIRMYSNLYIKEVILPR